MQLPPESASFNRRLLFGNYTARRLRTAGFQELADSVKSATSTVKSRGRSWEDAAEPIQDALADRDAAEDRLGTDAQELRLALASRSLDATQTAPYTQIFHAGIDYYTACPLDQTVARFQELITRVTESLPADDALRLEFVPRLEADIASFQEAVSALQTARSSEAVARTALETAQDDWALLMEKVYGTLVGEVGKRKAERFFPRRVDRSGDSEG